MKTLVRDGLSLYKFNDDEVITMEASRILVGNPLTLIIGDCNSQNTTLYENVTLPDDWYGSKYQFDGTTWTQDPNWQEPT